MQQCLDSDFARPEVETHSLLVDAASMFMVKDPSRFQIVVTSNLFGDILTDLGAAIAGGMGLAAGANLYPERKFPSMFEPIHGSAPDIEGVSAAGVGVRMNSRAPPGGLWGSRCTEQGARQRLVMGRPGCNMPAGESCF